MSSLRNVYHSDFKIALQLGLLNPKDAALIPRSSRYRFHNANYSALVGCEFSRFLFSHRDFISELSHCRKTLAICKTILSIKSTLVSIHSTYSDHIHSLAKKYHSVMQAVVSAISRSKDSLGIDKASSLFGISRATFFSWLSVISFPCSDSPVGRCVRRWPHQLSLSAVNTMKNLCFDHSVKGWPVSSIAFLAKRMGIISASLATWYKYSRLFGFSSRPPRCRKKRMEGIRALQPNRIWHADVTLFRTADGIIHYVYLVMDNFSRRILSWDCSSTLSASIRLSTIRNAWSACHSMISQNSSVQLFLDGGSENNNTLIDDFLSRDDILIRKVIAQIDVHYSNSMIEAVNKLLKYRYLFIQNIPDGTALRKHLDYFIPIYNNIRPHISLNGKTPYEAFFDKSFDGDDPLSSDIRSRFTPVVKPRVSCEVCL